MDNQLKKVFNQSFLSQEFQAAREFVCVDEKGEVIESPLAEDIGNRHFDHPYIRQATDSHVVRVETDKMTQLNETLRQIAAITDVVERSIEEGTYIWPLSVVSDDQGKLFQGETSLYVGFNWTDTFFKYLATQVKVSEDQLKVSFYEEVAEKIKQHQWLLSDIFSVTPTEMAFQAATIQKGYDFSFQEAPSPKIVISVAANPYKAEGLSLDQINFLHLFVMLMGYTVLIDNNIIETIDSKNLSAWVTDEKRMSPKEHEGPLVMLMAMGEMLKEMQLSEKYAGLLDEADVLFRHPEKTLTHQVALDLEKFPTFVAFGLEKTKRYKEETIEKPYILKGFEALEMSTQLLMFDAIKKGVRVEILDESDHLLRLRVGDHTELVKNANRTSHVTYIDSIVMENKHVTKLLLREQGYRVPNGKMYLNPTDAKADYWRYDGSPLVVKPKSTNAGIGITVFNEPTTRESFEEAVAIAFDEDKTILIEEFITGREFRFHVLGGRNRATLYRMPANVIGDGEHTVKELVDLKNEHPFRGEDGSKPFEKIKIGRIEKLILNEQGLDADDVVEEGKRVFLRENSNVSTGGDSINMTGKVDDSYVKIAEGISEALGARVCGVDLMIDDIHTPSIPENPGYAVIETNANPGMYGHLFVTEGGGERLTLDLLDTLFPELGLDR